MTLPCDDTQGETHAHLISAQVTADGLVVAVAAPAVRAVARTPLLLTREAGALELSVARSALELCKHTPIFGGAVAFLAVTKNYAPVGGAAVGSAEDTD